MEKHKKIKEIRVFSENLRKFRKTTGLSQEKFAAKAGYDRGYYGNLERGQHNPTLLTIVRLAKALGVKPYQLVK